MRIQQECIVTELGDEFVVVPIGDVAHKIHGVFRMNETGKAIWDALVDGMDETAMAAKLNETYDVDISTARRSIQAFSKQLRDAGLLVDD